MCFISLLQRISLFFRKTATLLQPKKNDTAAKNKKEGVLWIVKWPRNLTLGDFIWMLVLQSTLVAFILNLKCLSVCVAFLEWGYKRPAKHTVVVVLLRFCKWNKWGSPGSDCCWTTFSLKKLVFSFLGKYGPLSRVFWGREKP